MKEYVVQRRQGTQIGIEDAIWNEIEPLFMDCNPWPEYDTSIHTSVKLIKMDDGLALRFETDERPLRAALTQTHDHVCEDSCLEFFFRSENSLKYINLEINPLGTIYADYNWTEIPVDGKLLKLTSYITSERWILQYVLPDAVYETYFGPMGDWIYANFYKCGDKTVHPHYACWNPVSGEKPNFHQPESFGKLIISKWPGWGIPSRNALVFLL